MFIIKLLFLLITAIFGLIGNIISSVLKLVVGLFSLGGKRLKTFVAESESYTSAIKDKAEADYETMKKKVQEEVK